MLPSPVSFFFGERYLQKIILLWDKDVKSVQEVASSENICVFAETGRDPLICRSFLPSVGQLLILSQDRQRCLQVFGSDYVGILQVFLSFHLSQHSTGDSK